MYYNEAMEATVTHDEAIAEIAKYSLGDNGRFSFCEFFLNVSALYATYGIDTDYDGAAVLAICGF